MNQTLPLIESNLITTFNKRCRSFFRFTVGADLFAVDYFKRAVHHRLLALATLEALGVVLVSECYHCGVRNRLVASFTRRTELCLVTMLTVRFILMIVESLLWEGGATTGTAEVVSVPGLSQCHYHNVPYRLTTGGALLQEQCLVVTLAVRPVLVDMVALRGDRFFTMCADKVLLVPRLVHCLHYHILYRLMTAYAFNVTFGFYRLHFSHIRKRLRIYLYNDLVQRFELGSENLTSFRWYCWYFDTNCSYHFHGNK